MVTTRKLPAGFIVPAQSVEHERPPTGPGWVHEIKHDGYRLLGRREAEERSPWPNHASVCLSRFDELRRRDSARSAVLFAFDLIEHNSPTGFGEAIDSSKSRGVRHPL